MSRASVALIVTALLAGCATEREPGFPTPTTRLPDTAEVAAWVRANWADIGPRMLRMSNVPNVATHPIAVEDVACYYQYGTVECSYLATARYGESRTVRQQLFTQFERDAGDRLVEVIVMWHPRRR